MNRKRLKNCCLILSMIGLLSCGEVTSETENDQPKHSDTASSGIVEYDLNEDRLSAVDYNNELSLIQQGAYNQINILFLSDPTTVKQNYENVVFEIELKINALNNIKAPDGGTAFKKAVQDLLVFYKTELNNGFKIVLPILEKELEERSEVEEYQINEYDEQFAQEEAELFKVIAVEQEKFALENNFKISKL